MKPYKVAHPVKLEVTFKEPFYAEIVSYFRSVVCIQSRVYMNQNIRYVHDDLLAG